MLRDPAVFIMGEDIGKHGGAFGVTRTLFDQFGPNASHQHADQRKLDCRRRHRALPLSACGR